ncbi:MAG TPA: hypothetical protein VGF13_07070 [Verrucomicrobiae bacterium]|jgi:tetratricopeptide (TPR) repeat protein
MGAQKITNVGFLSEFLRRHEKLHDRPFCWVLGSGASIQSGIPAGGTLADQWLKELHEMEDFSGGPLEKWATAKNLGIENFDFAKAASFYPFIYQRRFRDYKDQGYAVLEDVMDKAEPSYGYSVLAQIMAGTEHKAAVTTNFDNLLADALAVYTSVLPLVCGHESLTGYIRPKLRRPLIAKIHRDLLLQPKNDPEEICELPKEWAEALRLILQTFTPIVIGYGGNDRSLMNFLKTADLIQGGIFWCHRVGKEPELAIQEIVERHHGKLVPILGFDELMLQLWEKLHLPDPLPHLQETHDKRKAEFQKQFVQLGERISAPGKTKAVEAELKPVREAAKAAVERLTKETEWHSKIDVQRTPYQNLEYAWYLAAVRHEYEKAERLFREAIQVDKQLAQAYCGLAYVMWKGRKDMREAEGFFQKALTIDSNCEKTRRYYTTFRKEYFA